MKLRPRIALTAIALSVPLAAVSIVVERTARTRATEEMLVAHARARLEGTGARDCARHPERWARPELPGVPPAHEISGWPPPPPLGPPPPFGGPPGGPPPGGPPPGGPPGPPDGPPPDGPPGSAPGLRDVSGPPIQVFAYDSSFHPKSPLFPEVSATMRAHSGNAPYVGERFIENGVAGDAVLVRGIGECAWVVARRPHPPFGKDTLSSLARDWAPPTMAMLLAIGLGLEPIVRRIRKLAAQVRVSARAHYEKPIALPGNDEIAELGHAFDEAGREVREHIETQKAREQTLRDFLGNTTHDVMTPLTVLQGHLAEMRRVIDEGGAVSRDTLSAAMDEAHYMTALVHNLGVAARLEAGEPHVARAKVDLSALVNRVVLRHGRIARQHEIELVHTTPEEPVPFVGDETFLEQAVSNVVYNAIRHNEPGGHVAVVLDARDGRFALEVLDDGPGIPAEEMSRVAERNVRGEAARTRAPDGHGLGLAITKKVADLHSLDLSFTAAEPRGLSVRIEGPIPAREDLR